MPSNRDLAACKRFYAKGGYVRSPSNRLSKIEQELGYTGQYFAGGGAVFENASGPALKSLIEYLGGYRRKPVEDVIKWAGDRPPSNELEKIASTNLLNSQNRDAAREYSGSGYMKINDWLRRNGAYATPQNLIKDLDLDRVAGDTYYAPARRVEAAKENEKKARQLLKLSETLKENPYELKNDIFRGGYTYNPEDKFGFSSTPQAHGLGFGSFTFDPRTARDFTAIVPDRYETDRVPSILRIKKGQAVPGWPISGISNHPTEHELLMAPRQGFDVTDLWKTKTGVPLIDLAPTQDFSYFTPQVYEDGGKVEWKAKLDAMIKKASKPDDTIINQNLRDQNDYLSPPGPREGKTAYAKGGVTLPNLPSKGVPQRGPMHYGSDEEGMAGGGEFLRWAKNLASLGTDAEQDAVKYVREHAKQTGNEAFALGRRAEPNYRVTPGEKTTVALPPYYDDFMHQGEDASIFSAHSHPVGSTTPSGGDINVWGNMLDRFEGQRPEDISRQAMWIAGMKGPHDVSVLEPITKNRMDAYRDVTRAQDVHMGRDMSAASGTKAAQLWDHMHDFTGNKYLFKPTDERQDISRMFEQGILANKLSEHLPLHFDPATPITPKGTDTIGDVWPEWLKYLKSKDFSPYAEGGKVDDLELAYNSQYFGDGGRVHHRHHKGPIEIDTETRKWLAYAGLLGGVT